MEYRENDTPMVSFDDLIENQKKIIQLHQIKALSGEGGNSELAESLSILHSLISVRCNFDASKAIAAKSSIGKFTGAVPCLSVPGGLK